MKGKSHVDYWSGRLIKRQVKEKEVFGWQIQIAHNGKRRWFNTYSNNKGEAAAKVRNFYMCLKVNGWDVALRQFGKEKRSEGQDLTIGEYFKEVDRVSTVSKATLEGYKRKFRTLLSEVFRINGELSKHDYVNEGWQAWVESIDAIKLSSLTPQKVQQWKKKRLDQCGSDPVKIRARRNSINTILRNSKSLFSQKILKNLPISPPEPLWFTDVDFEKNSKSRYISRVNVGDLVSKAKKKLRNGTLDDQQQYKIFILALGAGLRRDEIDKLKWENVDLEGNRVLILNTSDSSLKSDYSEADVDIHPSLSQDLEVFKKKASSVFVIESGVRPKPGATYPHYRAQRYFRKLSTWLRTNGVDSRKPLHELRKEFGSLVCASGGIFAASRQLRHADIRITRDHYLDKKERITVKI